jgi:hypothetical protein
MLAVCRLKHVELRRSNRLHQQKHRCFFSVRGAWKNVGILSSDGLESMEFAHVSSDLVTVLSDTDVSSTIVEPDSRQTLLHRLGFEACS